MGRFETTIRDTRIKMNMSQSELAERVGLSRSIICQYEKGQKMPRYSSLLKIAAVLNLDLKILMQEFIEPSKGFGWGRLKGQKNEFVYLPLYRNDLIRDDLVQEEVIPFLNLSALKGDYFWFRELNEIEGQSRALLIQQNDQVDINSHIVFQEANKRILHYGKVIDHSTITYINTGEPIVIENVIVIGKVVQIALFL